MRSSECWERRGAMVCKVRPKASGRSPCSSRIFHENLSGDESRIARGEFTGSMGKMGCVRVMQIMHVMHWQNVPADVEYQNASVSGEEACGDGGPLGLGTVSNRNIRC